MIDLSPGRAQVVGQLNSGRDAFHRLDIEPNLQEITSIGRAAAAVLKRLFDPDTGPRARTAYEAFIARIQAAGYGVETYQFPFIADEREVRFRARVQATLWMLSRLPYFSRSAG